MLCIKSIETEEVKLMLGVSLIIIAAAIVYMVETYIGTYYTIEYMRQQPRLNRPAGYRRDLGGNP